MDYLIEVGTEELPYKFILSAKKQLESAFQKLFKENQISFDNILFHATPRRLCVVVKNIALKQEDIEKIIKGPKSSIFYDESGNPTNAALGFMKKNNILDLLMICIFISIVISWIINDFPYKGILVFRFIITQGAFMTAYYIGKNLLVEESYRVFYNALLPSFVCAILGLILYVYQPGWYMAQVKNPLSLEALRLRSIFPSPYTCTYLSFFLISYLLAGNFKLIPNLRIDLSNKIIVVLYFIFIVLLLFGMMRAPIVGVLISVGLAVFHSLLINHQVKPLLTAIIFSFLFCAVGWLILDKCMDVESRDFLIKKFVVATDKDSDFLESRAQLFVAEETLFGDGAGRHAIYSDDYQEFVIADTCYQRLKQEVGAVGLIFHLLLFLFHL